MRIQSNIRINRLSLILSELLEIRKDSARRIINKTEVGKSLKQGDQTVLYDQETANVGEIISELKRNSKYYNRILRNITMQDIVLANKHNYNAPVTKAKLKIGKKPGLKERQKELLMKKNRNCMSYKKNVRTIEHDIGN